MRSFFRYVYVFIAWLFFGGIVLQVFLAGYGLLGGGDMNAHIGLGWSLPLITLPLFLIGWAAHPDRRTFWLTLLVLVLTFIQISLPSMRTTSPFIAALHPVNALALFWLSLTVARGATALIRRPAMAAVAPEEATAVQEA